MAATTLVGIIGTGGVATLHAAAIKATSGLAVAGAVSRDPDNVSWFVSTNGGRAYRTRAELLADPDIGAVAVCTPPAQHVAYALEALRAGKHVILEKPVARTVEDVDTLQREAAQASRLCMPCHNYIYAPAVQRAKALIDEGALGRIASLWMIYNQKHPVEMGKPDMALHELCVHHAYVLLYLLGRPVSMVAVSGNVHFSDPAADDQIMMVLTMPDGAIANLWGSFAANDRTSAPWTVTYKVLGTVGSFTYSWDDVTIGDAPMPGWDRLAYRDSFRHVYAHFADNCLSRGEPPLSTLADARDALSILETAEACFGKAANVDYR